MPLSVPSGSWHVIWCWQWPPVREKKRKKKDKGRRDLTTSWTCTRTVEVANGGWWRGHRRHFSEVCTDVITVIESFPLLSSAVMLGMFYSVLETLYVCVSELRPIVCRPSNPPLIGCKHSGASKKVGLFVKRLPCDWLKGPPVTALYWFKCLTFFCKGKEQGRDCWPVGRWASGRWKDL